MKILTISDSPNLYSGLARVHRHIIDGVVEAGHQVLPCVWFGYDDDTMQKIKDKKIKPPPLYYTTPNNTKVQMITIPKKRSFDDVKMLYDIVKVAKPDVILTVGDYWDFYYMQALKIKTNYSFKWIAYLTIEFEEIDERVNSVFRYADVMAVPTNLGRAALESASGKPITVIPYGVDPKFRKFSEDERRALREERDCVGKTRFITVAQNTWRKNLPALAQAVKLICHRDPERKMQFYVHANIDGLDSQEASLYDLRTIVQKLGVEDWFVFPEEDASIFNAPNDDYLINEYNASDYFVSPSTCEGYGLPLLEAMACGLPVIANGASVMPELIGRTQSELNYGPAERGWLVGNRVEVFPPAKFIKVIRHDALGQAIWEVTNWKDTQSLRENCINYAKERTWEVMKRGICKLLDSAGGPVALPVEVME